MKAKRMSYLVPLFLNILYILAIRQLFPPFVYVLLSLPVALYYFPVGLIVGEKYAIFPKSIDKNEFLASNLLFSTIISLSIISVYLGDTGSMHYVYYFIAAISNLFTIYCFYKEKFSGNLVIYFMYLMLSVAIIAN
jgi:hypothetical protein